MYLSRRTTQLMQASPAPVVPEPGAQMPQEGTQPTRTPMETSRPADAPQGLGEAPASINVRITIQGRECQLTLRDTSEERLLARLQTVLERYPVTEQPARSPQEQGQGKDWCAIHQTTMKWNEGKDGKRGWYSHKVDGQWCKGQKGRR
jgi:hypothetical protein